MPKGVSAILASVLIVLVSISLAGGFLVYSQRTTTQLTEAGERQQQTFQQQFSTKFVIEGIADNQVFLRNTGDVNITSFDVQTYIDDVFVNYTLLTAIEPGQTGTLNITEAWRAGVGTRILRVASGAHSDSVSVSVERSPGAFIHYSFEDSGTTVIDSSGNGNDGTAWSGNGQCSSPPSCPHRVQGRIGNGMMFTGINDQVNLSTVFTGPARITMCAWINPLNSTNFYNGIGGFHGNDGNGAAATFLQDNGGVNAGKIAFWLNTTAPNFYASAYDPVVRPYDQWYFYCGVYNGTHQMIFKDGERRATVSHTGTVESSPLVLGRWVGNYYNGTIDEFIMFNESYTPDRVYVINRA